MLNIQIRKQIKQLVELNRMQIKYSDYQKEESGIINWEGDDAG